MVEPGCVDLVDHGSLYDAPKWIYGPTHQAHTPIRSFDGQDLLTDSTLILDRWSEHF